MRDSSTAQMTHCRSSRAFTLVELLVTMSLIAILLSLLVPGVQSVRSRSRAYACQVNLRSVSFDFAIFADASLHGNRGDDAGSTFRLETFQESQYGIDEFWRRPGSIFTGSVADLGVMGCDEVRGEVILRSDTPCRSGAVQPARNVSYAFNLQLDSPEQLVGGFWIARQVPLSDRILNSPVARPDEIPLLWDIDGAVASERGVTPHYSAAPSEPGRPYGDGQEWFPSLRHGGTVQIAALDGSVRATDSPLEDADWRWDYRPVR
ncbi:MAG: prepilin-type N-terminal cleavage/methylation domain-containing protein [Phycisphaerales bacterium]|nr:prepilin-type N-terminal cleavage/methylation domain-containing protein [Phycisphaerales bacterium]